MNKTALITGASRGIGEACARRLAAEGYHLVITCGHSGEALLSLASDLESTYHIRCLPLVGDIGSYMFVASLFNQITVEFGGVDLLVNNAGISHIGLVSDMSIEEWDHLLATNLTSVFSCSKLAIPYMVHKKAGKIINISSVWGNVGASCEASYSACKGGINAFTKALAKELAPSNIQVNAIACGCIDTSMNACFTLEERAALEEEIPAGRFGSPAEVAELVLSLADGHDYLTGQIISLDGGWI